MNSLSGSFSSDTGPNLEIRIIPGKGRCVHAKAHFKKGDVIFEEDPLVCNQFAWNMEYKYLACEYCMRPLETVVQNINRLANLQLHEIMFPELDPTDVSQHTYCNECGVRYCSTLCLEKAYKQYHQNLCYKQEPGNPLYELNEKWKHLHYPPETTSIMLLAKVIATLEQASDQEWMYNNFLTFCNLTTDDGETLIHNLLSSKFENDISDLWMAFVTAMQSRQITGSRTNCIYELMTKDGFIKMLAMLGRNSQGVGTSVLAEWVKKVTKLDLPIDQKDQLNNFIDNIYCEIEKVSGTFLNNEGSALYLLHSSINHSCLPNAEVTFPYSNNRVVLIAVRDIMPDEEISISYLDECTQSMKYRKRQEYLRIHYLFNCQCPKCEQEALEQGEESDTETEFEFDDDSDNESAAENDGNLEDGYTMS